MITNAVGYHLKNYKLSRVFTNIIPPLLTDSLHLNPQDSARDIAKTNTATDTVTAASKATTATKSVQPTSCQPGTRLHHHTSIPWWPSTTTTLTSHPSPVYPRLIPASYHLPSHPTTYHNIRTMDTSEGPSLPASTTRIQCPPWCHLLGTTMEGIFMIRKRIGLRNTITRMDRNWMIHYQLYRVFEKHPRSRNIWQDLYNGNI